MATNRNVLVLGATRGIGGEVARQLRDAGWQVRALKRGATASVEHKDGMTWVGGDALNRQDVLDAAVGCSVIVHAATRPATAGGLSLSCRCSTTRSPRRSLKKATIVLPGTIYNYGPDAFPVLAETSSQHPLTRKGAIRVELERRLLEASRQGARVLIVRAGDFFGPKVGNSWFSQGLVKPGRPVKTVSYPGDRGVGHQWSYLPDVARSMVELLAQRETLQQCAAQDSALEWTQHGCSSLILRADTPMYRPVGISLPTAGQRRGVSSTHEC
jgi:nucleoside-diphosphate-sugar epimerase